MTTPEQAPESNPHAPSVGIVSSDWLASLTGKKVRRAPCGRMCEVTGASINTETGAWRVRIKDGPFWHGWVAGHTFKRRWLVLG